MDKFITAQEACERLAANPSRLYDLIKGETLMAYSGGGRQARRVVNADSLGSHAEHAEDTLAVSFIDLDAGFLSPSRDNRDRAEKTIMAFTFKRKDVEVAREGAYSFFFWSNEHYKRIEKILGQELSSETRKELQDAHRHFGINSSISFSRLSKVRDQLTKLVKALTKLSPIDEGTQQALILALPYTRCPFLIDVNRDLSKLLDRAEIALKNLPHKDRPGPDEKAFPLRTLVGSLKNIYEQATGKKAKLIKAVGTNEPKGVFFNFVIEFLAIVQYKPYSDFAVMGIIEEVIYS